MEISIRFEREDTKLKDLIYRRYGGNAKDIFSMPFSDGCELIGYALGAEEEDRLFLRWAVMYQAHMNFDEFRQKIGGGGREEDSRTAEDILKAVKGIIG